MRTTTAALVAVLALPAALDGQTARRESAWSLPRTPWGHPDLQGRWTSATLTPLQRPTELGSKEFFTESEAAEYAKTARERFIKENNLGFDETFSGELTRGVWEEDRAIVPTRRTSLIVGPTGRIPPQTPEAQARAQARNAGDRPRFEIADSPEERTLTERCLWFPVQGPPMLPSTIYNSNFEFVQTPHAILIHTELGGGVRIIALDGRPRLPEAIRFWQGHSRGHWEGDALVVETTNFSEKREFRGSGANLHVIERFTRVSDGMIRYAFTVEDATTWIAPWSAEVPMIRLTGLLYEFACHEGNYGLAGILRGARFAERP
jgi:hypothetical protein